MTRKDSEKDTDRPHYYSQFWLDVAAGRAVIGAPKVEEEAELPVPEADLEMPEPTPLRKAGRSTASSTDGHKPARAQTVVEPPFEPEEFTEPEESEFEQAYEVGDLELPNIVVDETEEETTSPEEEEMEEEEEDFYYDEEEEEEEEEDSWSARGRKKPKPGRQVKAPKLSRKSKREPRRGF